MINRYYTPTIEEFHVGFVCEMSTTPNKWVEVSITLNHFTHIKKWLEEGYIRVKYLDREDIESLGFEHDQTTKDGSYFYSGTLMSRSHWCLCLRNEVINIDDINNNSGLSFAGHIKNKSELSKLLKQLDIL